MAGPQRSLLRRPWFIVVAFAFVYDAARTDRIADGVTIGGVAVGGMSSGQARNQLRTALVEPLAEPIVVRRDGREWHLTPREAKVRVDIDASVDAALARSREGSFLSRSVRSIAGTELGLSLTPEATYSHSAVTRLVSRARRGVRTQPRDAELVFSGSRLAPRPSRNGAVLEQQRLERDLRAVMLAPGATRTVVAHTRAIRPKVTTAQLGARYPELITVNRSRFRLVLYRNLRRFKVYKIAVGRAGLETPAGLYSIQDKQENPSWHVPKSDWAGDLAGKVIPPGPTNPIQARWMGLHDGAGIHGTTDIASLGSAASHGCVRMAIPDVIDLYDRVAVGTPVYIS